MKRKYLIWIVIIAILSFPVKWYLFNPIYDSMRMQTLDKEQFYSLVNQVKGCEAGDNIYPTIDCHNQYDTVHAKAGVSFSTKNSQYYFIEKGGEPIWKSCLYKINGTVKELLPLPGNCHSWTWFQVGASKDSENLIVYHAGYDRYQYAVKDGGKIYRYIKLNPGN